MLELHFFMHLTSDMLTFLSVLVILEMSSDFFLGFFFEADLFKLDFNNSLTRALRSYPRLDFTVLNNLDILPVLGMREECGAIVFGPVNLSSVLITPSPASNLFSTWLSLDLPKLQ